MPDSNFYLSPKASKARLREAEQARKNRWEIINANTQGQVSRRDLIKMGLFTSAGLMLPISGLSPFGRSAFASSNIPTGLPPSPLFNTAAFSTPMPRFDVFPRIPVAALTPAPTAQSNQTQQPVDPALGGGTGPIEGRPPGPIWALLLFGLLPPAIAVDGSVEGAKTNTTYNPQVASTMNSGINPATPIPLKFHPNLPTQQVDKVWTYNGTIPPKLMLVRYGEPVLFRLHNRLSPVQSQNGGFGMHTISTHEHNGHHGAENDGFTGAYFFPNQFYDYHYPIVLAGRNSINTTATDSRASGPTDAGGLNKIPGDWHETMSTHWFHDHMFSFTAQNVYKGIAGMFNIYSGLDRGAEDVIDGVNLRLPSGRASVSGKSWGNVDYDVNLMIADKAWDASGQLAFDNFEFAGFLG